MTKYGLDHPTVQEAFIGSIARISHEHLSALDATSGHGQGVPREFLD